MHRFSVWAPRVKSISVCVNKVLHSLIQGEHGWWSVNVNDAEHGADYAFMLDDDVQPYPDPRSAWQPFGVHGSSRVLDHSCFGWTDSNWCAVPLTEAIIYELHVGTFTQEGTFAAAATKLRELKELRITHVELMPVNSFHGKWGWGYDGAALYAPQETYGGPEELKRLVDACHANGLAVLLDVVYNHFGPVGNYTGRFGPYITQNHHTPWGGAVNLEGYGSTEVRRFFCDNALMWLRDYHFDGLRLDAIQTFIDRSAIHFLEQLATEVSDLSHQLGRSLVLIAESDLNDPRVVTPRKEPSEKLECIGGYGMDAQWSDDFHHALFALLTGTRRTYYSDFGSLPQLVKALTSVYVFDGIYSGYRGRIHGRPVGNLDAHRFLGYIQNHDQVGNSPFSERLHALAGLRKAKLAAALVLTAPFVPMLFQGEEWAACSPFLYFAHHDDPELARSVSEGRRREHADDGEWDEIPDPVSEESFNRSKLIWDERTEPEHAKMLQWYQSLVQFRKTHLSELSRRIDNSQIVYDESASWVAITRGAICLCLNFGDAPVCMPAKEVRELLLASDSDIRLESDSVALPPTSFAAVST